MGRVVESKRVRCRRYYLHRCLRNMGFEVLSYQRTVNVPYGFDIDDYPKIKELQVMGYGIQVTLK